MISCIKAAEKCCKRVTGREQMILWDTKQPIRRGRKSRKDSWSWNTNTDFDLIKILWPKSSHVGFFFIRGWKTSISNLGHFLRLAASLPYLCYIQFTRNTICSVSKGQVPPEMNDFTAAVSHSHCGSFPPLDRGANYAGSFCFWLFAVQQDHWRCTFLKWWGVIWLWWLTKK